MKKVRNNKTGKGILVLVLLLAIGFAAVTTTLYINGTIKIGYDAEDYATNVIFKEGATLEYSDAQGKTVVQPTIENAGKELKFTVDKLSTIGESATVTYTIVNNSQYNAVLQNISCTATNDDGLTNNYIELVNSPVAGTVLAGGGEKANNTIQINLIRSFAGIKATEGTTGKDTTSYTVRCEIENAPEDADAPTTTTTTTTTVAGA